jgi:hypothetical protein
VSLLVLVLVLVLGCVANAGELAARVADVFEIIVVAEVVGHACSEVVCAPDHGVTARSDQSARRLAAPAPDHGLRRRRVGS